MPAKWEVAFELLDTANQRYRGTATRTIPGCKPFVFTTTGAYARKGHKDMTATLVQRARAAFAEHTAVEEKAEALDEVACGKSAAALLEALET